MNSIKIIEIKILPEICFCKIEKAQNPGHSEIIPVSGIGSRQLVSTFDYFKKFHQFSTSLRSFLISFDVIEISEEIIAHLQKFLATVNFLTEIGISFDYPADSEIFECHRLQNRKVISLFTDLFETIRYKPGLKKFRLKLPRLLDENDPIFFESRAADSLESIFSRVTHLYCSNYNFINLVPLKTDDYYKTFRGLLKNRRLEHLLFADNYEMVEILENNPNLTAVKITDIYLEQTLHQLFRLVSSPHRKIISLELSEGICSTDLFFKNWSNFYSLFQSKLTVLKINLTLNLPTDQLIDQPVDRSEYQPVDHPEYQPVDHSKYQPVDHSKYQPASQLEYQSLDQLANQSIDVLVKSEKKQKNQLVNQVLDRLIDIITKSTLIDLAMPIVWNNFASSDKKDWFARKLFISLCYSACRLVSIELITDDYSQFLNPETIITLWKALTSNSRLRTIVLGSLWYQDPGSKEFQDQHHYQNWKRQVENAWKSMDDYLVQNFSLTQIDVPEWKLPKNSQLKEILTRNRIISEFCTSLINKGYNQVHIRPLPKWLNQNFPKSLSLNFFESKQLISEVVSCFELAACIFEPKILSFISIKPNSFFTSELHRTIYATLIKKKQ